MIRQISLFDDNGKLIRAVTQSGTKLKEGWIVVYKKSLQEFIRECPNFATLKLFLMLSSMQSYDAYTYTSVPELAKLIDVTYQTAWNAVKWLQEHGYLLKTKKNGSSAFVVNPVITTCGKESLAEKEMLFSMDQGKVDVNVEEAIDEFEEELDENGDPIDDSLELPDVDPETDPRFNKLKGGSITL